MGNRSENKYWENSATEDRRNKILREKTLEFFKKIGIPDDVVRKHSVDFIHTGNLLPSLPDGDSWVNGMVFVGFKSLEVNEFNEEYKHRFYFSGDEEEAISLSLNSDISNQDEPNKVLSTNIIIGKNQPTINLKNTHNSTVPIVAGGISSITPSSLLMEKEPEGTFKAGGFIICVSPDFLQTVKDNLDYANKQKNFGIGSTTFVLTKATPINK
jgi:hypothetical protein